MRVVTWNLNHWHRSVDSRTRAWDFLRKELRADVALVQEAVPPPDLHWASAYRPIGGSRPWGSAVVVMTERLRLAARKRWPLGAPCYGEELPDSLPGATAVADIIDAATGHVQFTAISIYGQWEYMPDGAISSCPSVHRMLSDLAYLFVWGHKTPVLLAGDLNVTTQKAVENWTQLEIDEARALFQRIRALALHDCIGHTRLSRPGLPDCSCPEPNDCSHVRTYRARNLVESRPTQLDYAFASKPLLDRLTSCQVVDDEAAWALSDHCPMVLEFRDSGV